MTPPRCRWPNEPVPCSSRRRSGQSRAKPWPWRPFAAAMANQPADQVADLAGQAVAAGLNPLPEPGDPPWFQSAVTALNCAEHYDEAQVLTDAAVIEAQAAADGMMLPAVLAHRA